MERDRWAELEGEVTLSQRIGLRQRMAQYVVDFITYLDDGLAEVEVIEGDE